jgi:hypothetical protein
MMMMMTMPCQMTFPKLLPWDPTIPTFEMLQTTPNDQSLMIHLMRMMMKKTQWKSKRWQTFIPVRII